MRASTASGHTLARRRRRARQGPRHERQQHCPCDSQGHLPAFHVAYFPIVLFAAVLTITPDSSLLSRPEAFAARAALDTQLT